MKTRRSLLRIIAMGLVAGLIAVPGAAASADTQVVEVRQEDSSGSMEKLSVSGLVAEGRLQLSAQADIEAGHSRHLLEATSQDLSIASGYVSGSLYPSKHGCGIAFNAQATGWGSGSGSIYVALYQDGALLWSDSRNFVGSHGSYPLTDITCGPGQYRLASWVHHTNGYGWHETHRAIAC